MKYKIEIKETDNGDIEVRAIDTNNNICGRISISEDVLHKADNVSNAIGNSQAIIAEAEKILRRYYP